MMMNTKNSYGQMSYDRKTAGIFAGLLSVLLIYGIIAYGVQVLWMGIFSYLTMFIVEYLFQRVRQKKIGNTVIYLPLIYVLLLPPTLPIWIVIVGAFFISFFGKGVFGGDDNYVLHPVVAGIIFITISFPTFMNSGWIEPFTLDVSTSTPLILFNGGNLDISFWDLLNGNNVGLIGETYRIGIIALGIVAIFFKIVDWKILISYLTATVLFTLIIGLFNDGVLGDSILSIFVGSVLFTAFFIASDPSTKPLYTKGRLLYGIGLGLFTVLIRVYSAFPEGALFAVIIMNAISPLFDPEKERGLNE